MRVLLLLLLLLASLPCCSGQDNRDILIRYYFHIGYNYVEIVATLLIVHGIKLCVRQLKRILARLKLKRRVLRGDESSVDLIAAAIQQELQNSGESIGYRTMWRRLQLYHNLKINGDTVRQLLKAIDPEGVERRKRHRLSRRRYTAPGPNYLWHCDGYDKLKPFGFAIHGAVDGYSRRVVWLQVSPTNNDPAVIAWYYLNCLQQNGYAPMILRCDLGTENTTLEFLQPFFRYNCNDNLAGVRSFMYGKSTANQRIEAWWGLLRKHCTGWWINMFKDLRDRGFYNGHDPIHAQCLRYCFMDVLRFEIQRTAAEWNVHPIRSNKNGECPSGRPDVIYFSPELYDSRNYGTPVSNEDVAICKGLYGRSPPTDCSDEFLALVGILRPGIERPSTVNEAIDLYISLVYAMDNI